MGPLDMKEGIIIFVLLLLFCLIIFIIIVIKVKEEHLNKDKIFILGQKNDNEVYTSYETENSASGKKNI